MNQIYHDWIARARSPHTARSYQQSLNKWTGAFGTLPHGDTTETDLVNFSRSMAGLSQGTVSTHLKNIKSLLRWGHLEGYWQCPPSVLRYRVRSPGSSASSRFLSPEHARVIIAAAGDDRNRLILQCLFSLGLRNAELRGLEWSDLHYNRLKVRGKGGKVRSLLVLQELLDQLNLWKMASPGKGLIFRTHRSSSKLDGRDVWRVVKEATAKAQEADPSIPDASPHWFRHALASAALQGGATVKQVQVYLGHASGQTTLDTYAHVIGDVAIADFV
ncbi:MAG: tyrosine-type recombinase/integrase [Cyanobacteria bacterium P01_F01_bin.153]